MLAETVPCVDRSQCGGYGPHLHQRLLHGGPVGHPPSTLQDQVRVDVTFGLAVLRQGFPLVQLLRTPGDQGRPELSDFKLLPLHRKEKMFPPTEKGGLLWGAAVLEALKQGPPWSSKNSTPTAEQSSGPAEAGLSHFLQHTLKYSSF